MFSFDLALVFLSFSNRIEPPAEEKRSESLDDEQYEIDSQSSGNVYDLDIERCVSLESKLPFGAAVILENR